MNDYAPVIIFCYRRKIDKLIYSLLRNKESSNSKLFIFSDGFKSKLDENKSSGRGFFGFFNLKSK